MPELAAAYFVGLLANLVLLAVIVVREIRKGETTDNPLRGHIILGLICAALSWGGFVFFCLIEGSLAYIGRRKQHHG